MDTTGGSISILNRDGDADAACTPQSNQSAVSKELLLLVDWKRPLHVVVVVDQNGQEERIVTVYEPIAGQWSTDYRRRR